MVFQAGEINYAEVRLRTNVCVWGEACMQKAGGRVGGWDIGSEDPS